MRVPDTAIEKMYRGISPPVPQEFSLNTYGFKNVVINHHDMEGDEK